MRTLRSVLNLFLLLALACHSLAVPARPGILKMHNSDGSEINVKLIGDEFYHQYFTEDGYPLILKDNNFYYCDFDSDGNLIDSHILAMNIENRDNAAKDYIKGIDKNLLQSKILKRASKSPRLLSMANERSPFRGLRSKGGTNDGPPFEMGYGLYPDRHFPAYGNQKALVILVEYKDFKFDKSYDAKDYFTRMLNEDDFNDLGATGSGAQYFRENSNGYFTPEFDVYGPVTLSKNREYYGRNTWWGDDENPADMVKEACDALDHLIDFSEYDRDGDGVVDNIFLFYAGRGESSGGPDTSVWPHSWTMDAAGYPDLYYDGVRIYKYGCTNEWEISEVTQTGRPDGLGTFVHEFSHVLGLPDLYATNYSNSFTPGEWSALDYGPYNNDGMTPPNYGAFERYALGWLKPREINGPLSATLEPIGQNVCGIIKTPKPTEFFLLENRQKTGWDKFIPGHGMLIWHVDYDEQVWSDNIVNNSILHQYVDIVEADALETEYSRHGDTFPGFYNVTSFTPSTNPAMRLWSGEALNFPITDIAENDGIITFNVLGGADFEIQPVTALEPKDIQSESFTACWEKPEHGCDILLSVYTKDNGEKVYLNGFKDRFVGNVSEFEVIGTKPQSTYYYSVKQTTGWYTSASSNDQIVITNPYSINYFPVEALEATDIEETSFTANWNALDNAETYYLTVYRKLTGDPYYEENNFDSGVNNLGEWVVSSNVSTYGMASYSGKDVPSLRIPTGSSLTTPAYSDFINDIEFWHRGNSTSPEDHIDIYAITNNEELKIKSIPVVKESGGETVKLSDEIPEKTIKIKIQYIREGDQGYLALDDVRLSHGHHIDIIYLEDYSEKEIGNVLSHKVFNLAGSTDYYYTVRASDFSLSSKPSNEIHIRTKDSSGVSAIENTGLKIWADGNRNIYCTEPMVMSVYDLTGAKVASGEGRVMVSFPGIYIVTIPSRGISRKIIIK